MGDLSPHFNRQEFSCRCGCQTDTVDAELIMVLESLRERVGPISINSGNRCPSHNASEGGSTGSQHLVGKAADIVAHSATSSVVAEILIDQYPGKYGIGRYNGRTHIDVRSGPAARWNAT